MASLIEELITTLRGEQIIYEDLLPLAKKKTQIIVKNDLEELLAITEEEQSVVEKINVLEHKREEIVSNIGMVLSKKPEELHISKIIQALENQPEHRDQLSEIHQKLKKTIQKLVEINNHNQELIGQSLEMIEFNMNFIQSTRMSPGNSGYTKGASQFDGPMPQTGMFDAKQ